MTTEYQEPRRIRMSDSKLDDLEEQRNRILERCARRWGELRSVEEGRYWVEILPQALFDTLEAYDPKIATLAASAFIKMYPQYVAQPMSTAPKTTAEELRAISILGWCPDETAPDGGDWRVIWWEPKMNRGKGCWYGDRGLNENPIRWIALPSPLPR